MEPRQSLEPTAGTTEEVGLVSGRFLSDFFSSLERHGIPARQLLGDLPITIDEAGKVSHAVDWVDFVDFMKRLERHVGGKSELEAYGEQVGELRPVSMLHKFVGLSASPYSLYRAASQWALRRAMPGVQASIKEISPNRIEIRVHLAAGLRACPQIFHLATGGARALPRILGLSDAVVTANIGEFEADYQITVPPSRTLWARLTRHFRTIFSAGSVLEFLEAQQLELHAKHEELKLAKTALADSQQRHRTLTDAAVDVLCELDEKGHIVYVSASVEELLGYTPEQVTGSHFSLWVPGTYRDFAREQFDVYLDQPIPETVIRRHVQLHTETRGRIVAELSLRPYRTPDGDIRMVVILRDETDRVARKPRPRQEVIHNPRELDSVRALRESVERLQASPTPHPLERSLALLLASLESRPQDANGLDMEAMASSTERMTQIVERAVANSQEPSASFRWHDTEKFRESIQAEFGSRAANSERELRIDTTKAPPLFWAEDELLLVALGSLFDWTIEQTSPDLPIVLEIEGIDESDDAGRTIVFAIEGISADDLAKAFNDTEDVMTSSPRSSLALAAATDAANVLGGDLSQERVGPGRQVSRLHIPQPTIPAT